MRTLDNTKTKSALEAIGLNLVNYKRGPMGNHAVAMAKTSSGDGLRVWFPEGAEIKLSTDKRKKQAVLNIREAARAIQNKTWNLSIKFAHSLDANARSVAIEKFIKKHGQSQRVDYKFFIKAFPNQGNISDRHVLVNFVPNSTFYPKQVEITPSASSSGRFQVKFYGVSKTRRTSTCFLLGVDEKKHFISVLKKPVTTVSEAHAELRPDVSDKAIRQGEWFFDPVSVEEEVEILRARVTNTHYQRTDQRPLESGSSHVASHFFHKGKQYAVGNVRDRRSGYHATLTLPRLSRVVRNNERELQAVRNYD
jgi:hypothetical protein